MIGYKVVNSNYEEIINEHATKFEIGKAYHREPIEQLPQLLEGTSKISLRLRAAFYFHKDIISLFKTYDCYPGMRILEIIAENSEGVMGLAYQSTDITIMREISREQIIEYIYALDLPHSDNSKLREVSAIYSCSLEDLVSDEDEIVRSAVAERGFAPNILCNDDSALVRSSVAMSGNKLDILVSDPSPMVRLCVANNGCKLERLIDDGEYIIRKTVADYGYGVDRLLHDISERVREAADNYITYFM